MLLPHTRHKLQQVVYSKISISNSLGARKQTAVDCIHNRRSTDHPAAKVSAVEALDGVLATLNTIKLEIYVAL